MEELEKHSNTYKITTVGASTEGRAIKLIEVGNGPSKILIWSQMHGNEPTGTMVILDLLNFLDKYSSEPNIVEVLSSCTLYIVPMVNPDGAERWIRHNANQIDINRDFLATTTAEGKLLRHLRDTIQPEYGFNLHDQSSLWSVKNNLAPASLSFLAPAVDDNNSVTPARLKAMQIIAAIFEVAKKGLPNNIGLFEDSFEPRAFGDNFQKLNTSTILIEAGGLLGDQEKQELRKHYFLSLITGIYNIAQKKYTQQTEAQYRAIPSNDKKLYHLILKDVVVNGVISNLCLNFEEVGPKAEKLWSIHHLGDITGWHAYHLWTDGPYTIDEYVEVDTAAHFTLTKDNEIKLAFKNGILVD